MNLQPTLFSEKIEISPLLENDFKALIKAASDPLIWEQHPQPDRYKPEIFKAFFKEALSSQGAVIIRYKPTREVIGASRFYDFSKSEQSVLIGYTFLIRKCWGGVVNHELKRLMVNYSLQFVKTVYFQVGVHNLRSQKSLEKIGATIARTEDVVVSYAPPKKSYIYKIEKTL